MVGEKVLKMVLALIASIFVARYLGAESFGILSYAISLVSLFAVATHLGLNGLAVRELVNKPEKNDVLMGTILGMKLIAGLIAILFFLLFIYIDADNYDTEFWVLFIISGSILFKPFEIFNYWFQARVQAKYSSLAQTIAVLLISVGKLGLVYISAHLLAFATTQLLQAILIATLFMYFFYRQSKQFIISWKFDSGIAKDLISSGWMIMLGSIFAVIYLKIDQVMLRWLVDAEAVGVYAVVARLSEAWYFIPTAIAASIFPKLLELKKKSEAEFKLRLQHLFNFLFIAALIIAIIISLIAEPAIDFLYGEEYKAAANILTVHVWAGIFIFMRAAFSKWILIEDAIIFSLITQGLGALVNVMMNIILIPLYEGLGAAIATIISYAVASYFALAFYKKSRPLFWMMTKSIFFPLNLLKFFNK